MSDYRAVIEVSWLLAAIPGAELVGSVVRLRDGSELPVTELVSEMVLDQELWYAYGWAEVVDE